MRLMLVCPYPTHKDDFNPFLMFFVLISFFKVDFTAWSNSTAVENHLVGKAIFGLVGNHIRLAYIGPLQRVFNYSPMFSRRFTFFRWVLPAGQMLDRGRDLSGWKANSGFSGNLYRVGT